MVVRVSAESAVACTAAYTKWRSAVACTTVVVSDVTPFRYLLYVVCIDLWLYKLLFHPCVQAC